MNRKKESEQELYSHDKKEHSTVEVAVLVILLVVLFAVLCVLVWQLVGGISRSRETITVEGTELSGEDEKAETAENRSGSSEEGTAEGAGESSETEDLSENEKSGEEGSESENENSSGGDSQISASTGEAEAETGQAGVSGEGQNFSGNAEEENSQTSGQTAGTAASDGSMTFTAVDETVTAKSATNLRSEPSTASADTVVTVLESGMQAQRTGINEDTGWSRLSYEGQILYAVSSLLTTDLSGQTTGEVAADPDRVTTADGRVIIFTACDDTVSPKMSTNLRTEPSTSQGNATVYYELQYGETVHRTGYDADAGWSRVEYDGQILYAVTSYLYVVE